MTRADAVKVATARAQALAGESVRPFLRLPGFTAFSTPSGRTVQVWDGGPARVSELEPEGRTAADIRAEWAGVCRQLLELPDAEALSPRAQALRARRDALRAELSEQARQGAAV